MRKLNTIIALTFLFLVWTSQARADIPVTLTEYATRIVGEPTTVHCGDVPDTMYGYTNMVVRTYSDGRSETDFDPDIWLSRDTCSNLRLLYQRRILSYYWQANALGTLLHESYHIRLNTGDEGKVECTAMKNLWNYIVPYGFTRAQNLRLYRAAWDAHWSLGPEYQVGCPAEPEQLVSFGPMEKPKKRKD